MLKVNQLAIKQYLLSKGISLSEKQVNALHKTYFKLQYFNGVYVVEDTHTSYWESFGGSADKEASTMMNYFRDFIDKINYEEFNEKNYIPSLYETCITAIHFYHSIILIQKGDNTKGSIHNGKLNSYYKVANNNGE
jgi:hypothetical protein